MITASRKTARSWLFKELGSHFEKQGWRLSERPTSLLKMIQAPSPDVQHTLLVHEPFRPVDLPSPDVVGLACAVNVYFPALETLIDEVLSRSGPATGLSMRLALSQLVPPEHLFAGNVHLIPIGGGNMEQAISVFTKDFETYLEPARERLSASAIFEDEAWEPPKIDPWAWQLRRAAYYRRHMSSTKQKALFAELILKVNALLGPPAANDPIAVKAFADLSTLQKSVALRGAQELHQFLMALG